MPEDSESKRMSVTLSKDAIEALEWLANKYGISQVEAIRKAIATDFYIQKEMQEGSKILIQKADKEIREVYFR